MPHGPRRQPGLLKGVVDGEQADKEHQQLPIHQPQHPAGVQLAAGAQGAALGRLHPSPTWGRVLNPM
jgi:hypothetical protein